MKVRRRPRRCHASSCRRRGNGRRISGRSPSAILRLRARCGRSPRRAWEWRGRAVRRRGGYSKWYRRPSPVRTTIPPTVADAAVTALAVPVVTVARPRARGGHAGTAWGPARPVRPAPPGEISATSARAAGTTPAASSATTHTTIATDAEQPKTENRWLRACRRGNYLAAPKPKRVAERLRTRRRAAPCAFSRVPAVAIKIVSRRPRGHRLPTWRTPGWALPRR